MYLLPYSETSKINSGRLPTKEELFGSMEHYSFHSAIFGGAASGLYGLYTNHPVRTMVSNTMFIESSFINTFWIGLGISWVIGTGIGLGIALYQANSEPSS